MCIYCEAYENEHGDEEGQLSEETNHSEENNLEQSSKETTRSLRSVIADLI